jgi:hypothetical protein
MEQNNARSAGKNMPQTPGKVNGRNIVLNAAKKE